VGSLSGKGGGREMQLADLLKNVDFRLSSGSLHTDISGIYYDSRKVRAGSLFVCIAGFKTDGHDYVEQALEKGAVAILGEKQVPVSANTTFILVENSRAVLPILASNYYQNPSQHLRVVGVTGTNGKTTTTHLIKSILEEAGKKTGIMGTLYAKIDDTKKEMGHTTPEAVEIEEFMSLNLSHRASYVVMEVSSHALDLNRVDWIDFNYAILTNITQDHLDYHQTMEKYLEAKKKLFSMISNQNNNSVIINADDAYANEFLGRVQAPSTTYGIKNNADVRATDIKTGLQGSHFTVQYKNQKFSLDINLIGLFNVYNALAAVTFALVEGIGIATIKRALKKVQGVPGRFEQVNCGQDFTVVVDYAHTPDGLENILKTGRAITQNRMITVFGCGGDRDRSKRPIMGKIAASYSDFCVITSDNPRTEDPKDIIRDIVPGLDRVPNSRYAIIIDRKEAIKHALYLAKKGDLVVIAGKGHETYQIIKDQVLDFDDRVVASEILKGRPDL
jgi:UDP-N-acetylmuramoyl-L-alanyl-D-glutamate--2,6-diaminopimelate ligase